MGGTKIFVLQVKDLIRIGAFALVGIVVLIVLAVLFLQRPSQDANRQDAVELNAPAHVRYIPGTYTSRIVLNDRPVDVTVTVSEYEIVSVEMSELYESQRALFPLLEPMMERVSDDVLFYQTANIVIHNDFPVTTGILQQAVVAALDQAIMP